LNFNYTPFPLPVNIKYLLTAIPILFLTQTGKAQLCTGSLGDPVVNINFGSGNNPGPPLPVSATNYNYVTDVCPIDGSYTIVNSTSGCFGNSWHSLFEDHTPGDVNGYMMLVNASVQPGVFYLDTVKNLCGGTTYEFSAWLLNVLRNSACNGRGNMPDITFNIETITGTVIQTYNTGSITNLSFPQWNQYGFFFTLPPAYSELVLRMTNNAPGGCGNDLALDDIVFRPCGPKINAAFTNVNGINDTVNYCISDNKTITISGTLQAGYTNPTIQWQQSTDSGKTWKNIPGETHADYTATYSVGGRFQYRMAAAERGNMGITRCMIASNVLTINIDTIPVPQAGSTSPACINTPVNFFAKNGDFYKWTGPAGFSSDQASPVIAAASFVNAGTYYVLVTTKGGCRKLDSAIVLVSALPVASAGNDTAICESTFIKLHATGGVEYTWQPVSGLSDASVANPVASPSVTTSYTVLVRNQFRCTARDTIVVAVLKKPVSDAGADKKILEGQSVALNGTAAGDTASYYWTPVQYINNNKIKTPVVNPVNDITYTFHVVSGDGCGIATDDVFVRVLKKVSVPNAFSPNGDGINDVWNIEALSLYPESETNVFNRYGQLVFHSQGYSHAWDGRLNGKRLPVGTYYYTIDRKNNFAIMSGWLMIIY